MSDESKTEFRLSALEQKTDRVLDNQEAMRENQEAMRLTLTRLETRFNGGPGNWPSCRMHAESLTDMQLRLRSVERRIWAWAGGMSVVILAGGLLSPQLQRLLSALFP